ncbi:sensor histidine kinase [Larkinella sp. VNQ87]|uniref:sensor histidine kinase n=1 Tax=Larkinella sp. VNQ87 TaxID=3400921 RepID=UPI003C029C19
MNNLERTAPPRPEEAGKKPFSARTLLWQLFGFTLLLGFVSDLNVVGWQPDLLLLLTVNGIVLTLVVFWLVIRPVKWFSDRWLSWRDAPYRKLLFTIFLSGLGAVLVLLAELQLFMVLFNEAENEPSRNFHDLLFAFLITMIGAAIYSSTDFFAYWRRELVRSETLEKEKALAQLATLKSQLNPHFLFNSLNTLASLTHQDPARARDCIQQLARVYRYVLENRDADLVPLQQELQFLTAYGNLLQARFGPALQIDPGNAVHSSGYVPPLVVQMLVENAVKHNMVSIKKPLRIQVYREGDQLIVRNNRQPKIDQVYSSGMGLTNIQTRYSYLTDKQLSIQETTDWFTVKLPLL